MPDDAPAKKRSGKPTEGAAEPVATPGEPAEEGTSTPTVAPPESPTTKPKAPARKPRPTSATKVGPPSTPRPAKTAEPKESAKPSPARPSAKPTPAPSEEWPASTTVVDASGLVLGRAASLIAKRLLNGETIVVVNAEKSVVTGNRQMVVADYTTKRARGSVRSGPHYPRYPDRIFRRTVRGMLPHLKTRGKVALDRLHVFIGTPSSVSGRSTVTLEGAKARPALRPPTSLEDITKLLGARL